MSALKELEDLSGVLASIQGRAFDMNLELTALLQLRTLRRVHHGADLVGDAASCLSALVVNLNALLTELQNTEQALRSTTDA